MCDTKWCQLFTGEFITYCIVDKILMQFFFHSENFVIYFLLWIPIYKCDAKGLSPFLTKLPRFDASYVSAPQCVVAVYCAWWNCMKYISVQHFITFSYFNFQCLWITQNFQAIWQLTTFRLHILRPTREVTLFGLEKEFVENNMTKANLCEITTTLASMQNNNKTKKLININA